MEVILLEPVRKLGKIGDVVKVKDGFGKNFLLPNKKALRATKDNLLIFESKKSDLHSRNEKMKVEAQALVSSLADKSWVVIRQAAADGRLFGSVTGKEIAKVISDDSASISHSHVVLNDAIKNIGIFKVEISPYTDVSVEVLINVARSHNEANDAMNAYKTPKVAVSKESSSIANDNDSVESV